MLHVNLNRHVCHDHHCRHNHHHPLSVGVDENFKSQIHKLHLNPMLSGNVKQPEGEHILLGQLAGIDKKSRLQANTTHKCKCNLKSQS